MTELKFQLRPIPGNDAVRRLYSAARQAFPNVACGLTIDTNLRDGHFNAQQITLADGDAKSNALLEEIDAAFLDKQYIICKKVALSNVQGWHIEYSNGDGVVAQVLARIGDQNRYNSSVDLIADALSSNFDFNPHSAIIDASLPKEMQDRLRYYERALSELTANVSKLGTMAAKEQKRQSEFVRKQLDELDARYKEKDEALEAVYRKKEADLASREEGHRAKVAEFELRESKAVRRSLLVEMKNDIKAQKTIKLSDETNKKRAIISNTCFVAMGVGLVLALVFGLGALFGSNTDWHFLIPTSAGVLLFASTLIFFIKWNDQWFREHASAEFRNMRFSADILRASWFAELLFEWVGEKQTDLPESVVTSFTRNLFLDERLAEAEHPAEAIGKLLGGVEKIHVGKDGLDVTRKATGKK
ncbi:MAG: hypothetical protein H6819_04895 [Phycisphaerales bacterium]|nr:hypothetical protein [Phycisphaerales bacterium]MCB9854883.1 hypothetical protein [Phycisphaerales bacterium]